jgi:hypothetical protein
MTRKPRVWNTMTWAHRLQVDDYEWKIYRRCPTCDGEGCPDVPESECDAGMQVWRLETVEDLRRWAREVLDKL